MRHALALLLVLLPAAAGAQTPTGTIAGRVATPSAALLPDALVTLMSFDGGLVRENRTVTTGAHGEFRFDGLPAGPYVLSAAHPGFTSAELPAPDAPLVAPIAAAFLAAPQSQMIELEAAEQIAGVELLLRREASITGRILQQDGTPAAGVRVGAAYRLGSTWVTLLRVGATSERDGRYRITGLPPGAFAVLVQPPRGPGARTSAGFATTYYPGVTDEAQAVPVRAFEGTSAEGIDIWLTPARHYLVSGRVYWPANVTPENIAIEYGDPDEGRAAVWLLSDPGGLFSLTDAPRGTLVLLARADSDVGPLAGLVSTQVSVDAVYDVALTLDRPGRLEGRVVYGPSVEAPASPPTIRLRQTLVHVSSLYPVPESPSDDAGRFAIDHLLGEYAFEVPDLPPGLRIARLQRNGMALPNARIRVAGGEHVTGVEIVVERAP
jgi:hypothetical protein